MKAQINENQLPDICNKVSKTAVYSEHVGTKYLYAKNLAKVVFLKNLSKRSLIYKVFH